MLFGLCYHDIQSIIFIDVLPEEESKSAVAIVGVVLGVIIFILVAFIIVLGIALRVSLGYSSVIA